MRDHQLHQLPVPDLAHLFLRAAAHYPERPAVEVEGATLTYAALRDRALAVAASIQALGDPSPVVCMLAERSAEACAAMLGILCAGRGYVPLNPRFPAARTRSMVEASKARTLLVAREGMGALAELAPLLSRPVTLLCLDGVDPGEAAARAPGHTVVVQGGDASEWVPPQVASSDVAYLLFTSGSTGKPKGVPIRHANVGAYLEGTLPRYRPGPGDRCSQTFDLTFDLSVHDHFVTWANGSCLCVLSRSALMAPARFIRSAGLTTWFSVPSVVTLLDRMRLLRPGSFPDLRLSLFCGEALLGSQAASWQRAAPASVVENLYGPTEATIAITRYRWIPGESEALCVNGIVPIGTAFPRHAACILDPSGTELEPGVSGELYLAGPQVAAGYLEDPERTADRFVSFPSRGPDTWYRTGDLAVRGEGGVLHFVGRVDDQVQVRGFRVELAEVDHALRKAVGSPAVAAVAWPPGPGNAEVIHAFVEGIDGVDESALREACREALPPYMVPERIFTLERFPRNANGKLDRKALLAHLEDRLHAERG